MIFLEETSRIWTSLGQGVVVVEDNRGFVAVSQAGIELAKSRLSWQSSLKQEDREGQVDNSPAI